MRPLAGLVVAFALALLALVPVAALAPSTALAHAPTSALPHETGAPEPPTPKQLDEARQLTDGLRAGATSKPRADAIRDRLARQATRRAALLADIAVRDPRAALDLALSPAERAALPQDVQGSVEAWTDLDGDLVVLHVDDEHGRGYYDVKLVVGGTETTLHVGGTVGAQPGDEVKVTGVRLPGDNSVVAEQVIAQRAGSGVGPTGPQRTAIILAGPRGASAHPYADKSAVASMFFSTTSGRSARAWYDEASYGQATIVGGSGTEGTAADVYGPYTVNSATCSTTTIRTEAFAAADAQLNFNRYDRVMIVWNHPPCGNGGVGTVRSASVGTYDGGAQFVSVAWVFNAAFGSPGVGNKIGGLALHEYGHNVGAWHANALECGTVAINGPTCASPEYGDPADVMGGLLEYGHFNGLHKDTVGWLSGRAQTINASGSYKLTPYEDPASGIKVFKIPRMRNAQGSPISYYYLEYRRPTAQWNAYAASRPNYTAGVLIHAGGALPICSVYCGPDFYGPEGGGDSHLIDTRPNSLAGAADWLDAPLMPGQIYTDAAAGVSIGLVSTDASTATLNIALSQPTPSIQSTVYPESVGYVTGGGAVANGQAVTLTAVPNGGYTFLH